MTFIDYVPMSYYAQAVAASRREDRTPRPQAGDPPVLCDRCRSLGHAQRHPVTRTWPVLQLVGAGSTAVWQPTGATVTYCQACSDGLTDVEIFAASHIWV